MCFHFSHYAFSSSEFRQNRRSWKLFPKNIETSENDEHVKLYWCDLFTAFDGDIFDFFVCKLQCYGIDLFSFDLTNGN